MPRAAGSVRVTFLCHAATQATRRSAFPAPDDALAPRALVRLPAGLLGRDRVNACWSSPAACAVETAAALSLDPGREPLLRDCDYGRWAGLTLADVEQREPDGLAAWFAHPDACPHGGEPLSAVAARVHAWLSLRAATPGRFVAVTHPLVIRIAVVLTLGAPLSAVWRVDVAPLSLTRLSAEGGRWRIASANEVR